MKTAAILPEEPFRTVLKKRWLPRAMVTPPLLDPAAPGAAVEPRYALLINPFYPKDPHASFGKHVLTPTLALTSIAGATPPEWRLQYWDENLLQGRPPHEPMPQVVGITVHLTFAKRAYDGGMVSRAGRARRPRRLARALVPGGSRAACGRARDRRRRATLAAHPARRGARRVEEPLPRDLRNGLLHYHGIQVNGSFVLGFDEDRRDCFAMLAQWIEASRLECATFHILTPYPGTPLFSKMEREGRLLHQD